MGLLVAIEGIDGSGKGTQATRLLESLRAQGTRAELFSFPRYRETQFGRKIGDYLNGRFGNLDEVSPFLVSLLFAGDRFESSQQLRYALSTNEIVLCDRYTASNIAHQAAKVQGAEREELIEWVQFVEHQLYQLPHADRTLFLDLPVQCASHLIAQKSKRCYTDRAADLQEANTEYLQCVHDVYTHLSATGPGWIRIECATSQQIKSIEQVAEDVWKAVKEIRNPNIEIRNKFESEKE